MSKLCMVLGETANGKTTGVATLNPKETFIINVLGKVLPFKNAQANYNKDNHNIVATDKYKDVESVLNSISQKMPHIKNIVIDDATYILRNDFLNRSDEKGYDKYNIIADSFRKLILQCNMLRDDINVFLLLHAEPVDTDGTIIGYKCSTVGKLIDKMFRPEESASIVLFAKFKFNEKGNAEFGLYTHACKQDGVVIPAKSPVGMFSENIIPNDYGLVASKMNEYFGGTPN